MARSVVRSIIYNLKAASKNNLNIFLVYWEFALLFLFPQLSLKYPSLIDDGYDLLVAQNSSFLGILYNELFINFRTWPVKLLYRKILYSLFGFNVAYHFFVYSFLLACICFFVFIILKQLNIRQIISWLAGLSIFLLPAVAASYYRLGTSEPLQILILLLGIIALIRDWQFTAIILFAINLFVKETSVFYMIIPLAYYVRLHKKREAILCGVLLCMFSSMLIWKQATMHADYLTKAYFSLDHMVTAFSVSKITALCFITLPIWVYLWKVHKNISTRHMMILIAFIGSVMSVSIWDANLLYYHLVSQVLCVVYIFITLTVVFNIEQRNAGVVTKTILYIFVIIFPLSIRHTISIIKIEHRRYVTQGALVKYILEHNWNNYSIYSSESEYEPNENIYNYFIQWKKYALIPQFFPLDTMRYRYQTESSIAVNSSQAVQHEFENDTTVHAVLISPKKLNIFGYQESPLCGVSPIWGKQCAYYAYKK